MIEAKEDQNQMIHVTHSLSMWILFIDEKKNRVTNIIIDFIQNQPHKP